MTRGQSHSACLAILVCAVFLSAACDDAVESSDPPPSTTPSATARVLAASGSAAAPAAADWCAGHGLPESKCTKCNPELVAKFKGEGDWCEEHQFPESACPTCNPQPAPTAAAAATDWCAEHGLPESKCTKCNPELVAKFKAEGDWCAEHQFPESVCPVCNPGRAPTVAARVQSGAKIRLKSLEVERTAGIETAPARAANGPGSVRCNGRVQFDEDAVADVRALFDGVVSEVHVSPGDRVRAGETLFTLGSGDIADRQGKLAAARARVAAAEANLRRQRRLRDAGVSSQRTLELAQRELDVAKGDERAASGALRLSGAGRSGGSFTVKAPVAGTVVRRPGIVGLRATATTHLALIADPARIWLVCDVDETDAGGVAVGSELTLRTSGGGATSASISWVSPEVAPATHTVRVRANLSEPPPGLRAGQVGVGSIAVAPPAGAVMVHRDAVQTAEGSTLVFVRVGDALYEPRLVRHWYDAGTHASVSGNLKPGDEVATRGAFLLKTELLPGAIGAGCCEVE